MRQCAWKDCSNPAGPRGGKYCRDCAKVARAKWRDRIEKGNADRDRRRAEHASLWARAVEAGRRAAEACQPTPMVVTTAAGEHIQTVEAGPCGFASIVVRPGNSSFAHWLKKNAGADRHYYGGVFVWVGDYNQSYARKVAHADAAAEVLRDAGIQASTDSRLD